MSKKVKIFRAGITSFLAYIMLKDAGYSCELVISSMDEMKQKHFALLRFGDDSFERVTGIKCDEVKIQKSIYHGQKHHSQSNICFDNEYSMKVTGILMPRSIGDLKTGTRYVPPVDFWDQLVSKIDPDDIVCLPDEADYKKELFAKDGSIVISTLHMNKMQEFLDQEDKLDFDTKVQKIKTINFDLPSHIQSEVCQTIYMPNPDTKVYRVTLDKNKVTAELCVRGAEEMEKHYLSEEKLNSYDRSNIAKIMHQAFGLPFMKSDEVDFTTHEQAFGKIVPVDEDKRKAFIYNLTQEFGIYSLGRFATWRSVMIDDAIKDIEKIIKWVYLKNTTSYDRMNALAAAMNDIGGKPNDD